MLQRLIFGGDRQTSADGPGLGGAHAGDDAGTRARRGYIGSMAPRMETAPEAVRNEVAALARSGAVDEGTGDVLDKPITSWVDQWHNDIDEYYDSIQRQLRIKEAEASAELNSWKAEEAQIVQRIARLDADIATLSAPRAAGRASLWRRLGDRFRRRERTATPEGS